MTDTTNKTKRPSSITLISVFAVIAGFDLFYFLLSPGLQNFIQDHGVGDTLLFAFSGVIGLVSGVGFWFMKKWAVYALIAFAAIAQVYLLFVGRWNVFSLLIPAVVIFVAYKHLSKMT